MGQRGTKSAEEQASRLNVISVDNRRLKPPAYLSADGRKVFEEVVGASDPRAFRKAELPLLCAFCEAVVVSRCTAAALAEERTEGFDLSYRQWIESTKLLATLATRLRLTPHSRMDARAAGRLRSAMKMPWEFEGENEK